MGGYLDCLVSQCVDDKSSDTVMPATTTTTTTTAAMVPSDDVIELLGGSGGGGSIMITTTDQVPKVLGTEYRPALQSDLGLTILLTGSTMLDLTLLAASNNKFFGSDPVSNKDFKCIRALVQDVGAAKKCAIGC